MTDKDFRQLKSMRTPEKWIENALMIPQKKNKPPFLLRPSVIGAAASLLIIAAAALTLFLNLRKLSEPSPPTVFQTVTPTDSTATVTEPVQVASPSTTQPTAASSSPSTAAVSQAPSSSQSAPAVSPVLSPTVKPTVSPTVSPTVKSTVSPTVSPTVKPTGSPTVPPTFKPTAAPTAPATYATQPLTEPTEAKPTVPATVPATPPREEVLYYMGRIIFLAEQGSAFADSASVRVTLSQSGYAYSNLTVPLRSDGAGGMRGVLPVYEEAILLYTDSACTVTVSGSGRTVSKTVFLTFGNDVIIKL